MTCKHCRTHEQILYYYYGRWVCGDCFAELLGTMDESELIGILADCG